MTHCASGAGTMHGCGTVAQHRTFWRHPVRGVTIVSNHVCVRLVSVSQMFLQLKSLGASSSCNMDIRHLKIASIPHNHPKPRAATCIRVFVNTMIIFCPAIIWRGTACASAKDTLSVVPSSFRQHLGPSAPDWLYERW